MVSMIFAVLTTLLLLWAGVSMFIWFLRYDLRMFQQHSYRPERFWRWWGGSGNWFSAFLDWMLRIPAKLPLVVTARVKRLMATDILLTLLLFCAGVWGLLRLSGASSTGVLPWNGWALPLAVCLTLSCLLAASKCLLLLANAVNQPMEKAISRWYYNDARKRLKAHKDLIVIGVTGSYGKTSTKNYLYRILSEQYNVLVTPGNFNTTLGVVRTVREQLQPWHQVFIVEMGAKQPGDIQEICELVHPSIGIVASVGPMHLETFGSLENIQKTKFELVRALPADGFAAINADSPGIASYRDVPTHCCVVRYGVRNGDFRALNVAYSTEGSSFDLGGVTMKTTLLGESNIQNILAACAVATRLGVSPERQKCAIAKLQQVEHRLFVSRRGAYTVIDDAYNSNPGGAAMALDVLRDFRGGRKFLITPGFVELGTAQAEECRKLGYKAASCADVLMIVNKVNRDAILSGAREAMAEASSRTDGASSPKETVRLTEENIHCPDDLSVVFPLLDKLVRPGDVVLYENDLPDTFI